MASLLTSDSGSTLVNPLADSKTAVPCVAETRPSEKIASEKSADLSALVDLLRQPRMFHDGNQVQMVETHISWVFLTERFAYKLKKPVRFEFLDFSSLELRRLDCLQELKLNRRLAPDVYLDVVPVTRDGRGRIQVGGNGRPIDWLVKMKRLPQANCLSQLLVDHLLTKNDLDRLATSLSRFYERLPPVTVHASEYLRGLERHVIANHEELVRGDLDVPPELLARVHAAQQRFVHMGREILIDRVRDGRIVDGHGDLRPEHVYLMSTPKVIDCVEFSEELRRVDVADELAFLAMECDLLGDSAVGKRILEVYTGMSGDRVSPRLLAFYKTYRACVRAKVFLLRSRQVPAEEAVRLRAVAESYLRLADTYVPVVDAPCLLVVRGLSGAGKSTVAEALARELGAEAIQTDQVRRRLFPDASPTPFGQGAYSEDKRRQVYDEVFRLASERLAQGLSVVLDGTFLSRALRCRALELAAHLQVPALLIPCACDPTIAQERVRERLAARSGLSDAQPDLVESQGRLNDPDDPQWPVCLVDTSEGLPVVLAKIYDSLRPRLGYE